MTLFDWTVLLVALLISYFGAISLFITLMIGIAVIIVVRLLKGERVP
jgi:hypothetical protein